MRVSLARRGGGSDDGGEVCGLDCGHEREVGGRTSGSSGGKVYVEGEKEALKGMLARLEGLRARGR